MIRSGGLPHTCNGNLRRLHPLTHRGGCVNEVNPDYQGNRTWILPIPATFVIAQDGIITARFIDPDYRKRMTIEDSGGPRDWLAPLERPIGHVERNERGC